MDVCLSAAEARELERIVREGRGEARLYRRARCDHWVQAAADGRRLAAQVAAFQEWAKGSNALIIWRHREIRFIFGSTRMRRVRRLHAGESSQLPEAVAWNGPNSP